MEKNCVLFTLKGLNLSRQEVEIRQLSVFLIEVDHADIIYLININLDINLKGVINNVISKTTITLNDQNAVVVIMPIQVFTLITVTVD